MAQRLLDGGDGFSENIHVAVTPDLKSLALRAAAKSRRHKTFSEFIRAVIEDGSKRELGEAA